MRFINGNRNDKSGGRKAGFASGMFKLGMSGKKPPEPTPQEKYQKMFDEKMEKIMSELAQGKKKGFVIPGTKQDNKPKEMSKNFKATMELLARKKAQAALKKQKKKEHEAERKKYFDKVAKLNKEKMEMFKKEQLRQQELELAAKQQESAAGSYFFGNTPETKDSWW